MSNGLDKYLQAVAHELRGLEPEQRESELREMRGHLEAIVARLVEGGLSEEEAVAAACAQFGAARRVGRELRRASRKRDSRAKTAEALGRAMLWHFSVYPLAWLADTYCPEWSYFLVLATLPMAFLVPGMVAVRVAPHSGARVVLGFFSSWCALALATGGPIEYNVGNTVTTLVAWLLVWIGTRVGSRYSQRRTDAQRA